VLLIYVANAVFIVFICDADETTDVHQAAAEHLPYHPVSMVEWTAEVPR